MLNRATAGLVSGHATRCIARLPMPAILAGLVVVGLLLVARLASGAVERLEHAPGASHKATPATVSIGAARLAIPRHMIRRDAEAAAGRERIELHLHWPSLEGYTAARAPQFRAGASSRAIVYVSLRPQGDGLSPRERLHGLYPRLLADDTRRLSDGLVVRRFRDGHGYDGEALYIAADALKPLIARCPDDEDPVPASCLSGFRTDAGLDVGYRFPLALMEDWRRLDADLRALVDDFLALAAED